MTATATEFPPKANDFHLFVRPLRYLSQQKLRVTYAYLGSFGQSAIALLIPQLVKSIVDSGIGNVPLGHSMPLVVSLIGDTGIAASKTSLVTWAVVLLLLLSVLRGYCTYLAGVSSEMMSQGAAYRLRNQMYDRLCHLSFRFHDTSQAGDLLARASQDVERLRFLCGRALLSILNAVLLMVATTIVLLLMNPTLALLAMSIIPLITYQAWTFAVRYRPLSQKIQEQLGTLTTVLEQNLRGIRVVKAFAQEEVQVDQFHRANTEWFRLSAEAARLRSIRIPLLDFIAGLGTVVVMYFGGRAVISHTITLGDLLAFTTYLAQLIVPIRRMGMIIPFVAMAGASSQRVFEILDKQSDITDKPQAIEMPPVKGRVEFQRVSFNYTDTNRAITDVDFMVEPGQILALLGPTGSGKSTLINLIPRFYDPSGGTIRIDGFDIRDVTLHSLRRQISSVLQDPLLFATTISENIGFGMEEPSEDQIVEAAKAAQAHDFIMEMPQQYDTRIGERGITLSGGQRQRISIARALITNPRILILDDATSSVDTETERQIQKALDQLMENRTSIVIAQRLSTVQRANKILLLDKGRVSAFGTHDDLWQESRLYRSIYEGQMRP